jgi:hypothetical protein
MRVNFIDSPGESAAEYALNMKESGVCSSPTVEIVVKDSG